MSYTTLALALIALEPLTADIVLQVGYILYLYLSKVVFEVFTCRATVPPDFVSALCQPFWSACHDSFFTVNIDR